MQANYYYTYMLTNRRHTVLYIGVTGQLATRIWQHKQQLTDGFTKRYNLDKLVYLEAYRQAYQAIAREKQLKGWTRQKKEALLDRVNPEWRDLYEEIT